MRGGGGWPGRGAVTGGVAAGEAAMARVAGVVLKVALGPAASESGAMVLAVGPVVCLGEVVWARRVVGRGWRVAVWVSCVGVLCHGRCGRWLGAPFCRCWPP